MICRTKLIFKIMKSNLCKNVNTVPVCLLNTTGVLSSKFREADMLNKLMGKFSKKRRPWQPEVSSKPDAMTSMLKPSVGKQHLRRIKVLNKVFMEHITDLMTAGDIAEKVAGLSIEISEVKISPEFTFLSVYWTSSSTESDSVLENCLQAVAFPLRHELSKLNVIGSIPRVVFVKDTRCNQMDAIDRLLREAEYGDDFVPTNPSLFPGREFPVSVPSDLNSSTAEDITEAEKTADALRTAQQKEVDELMSLMRYDIFGLDQRVIMNRIKVSVIKSKALHRKNVAFNEKGTDCYEEKENLATINKRIEAMKSNSFSEFLSKRKKMIEKEKKMHERALTKPPELQMREEEINTRIRNEFDEEKSNFEFYHTKDLN